MTLSDRIKAMFGHVDQVVAEGRLTPDRSPTGQGEEHAHIVDAADVESREGVGTTDDSQRIPSVRGGATPDLDEIDPLKAELIADRITQALLNRLVSMPGSVDIFGELRQVILTAIRASS